MNEPLMLCFDIGTQSVRAVFVDKKGNVVDFQQIKYEVPYISDKPGWAEQEADFYYDACCEASRGLLLRSEDKLSQIVGVTFATIRDTTICLDSDLKPLRRAIVWLDKREEENAKPIPAVKKAMFRAVNMYDVTNTQRKQSVCNWIMVNQPDIWAKTHKYVLLSTYLNYKFCGVLKDSAANMIGHVPIDYKKRKWMGKDGLTRCLFDVPTEKLCELCEPGDIIGEISLVASEKSGIPAGVPLIVAGNDKSCETLGLSVLKPNQAALSFGTTAVIQLATDKYFEPFPFLPSYPAVVKDYYNAEIQVYRGYWMISWFKHEFAQKEVKEAEKLGVSAEELLNSRLAEIPAGSEGLLLQPFWGPGVFNPNAKGAIIGFGDVHTRIHIYRAIIEGIGFALLGGMYRLEKRSGRKVEEIFVGGGGSQSDEICQITANMFGLPVKRIHTHEACSIGAGIVGFVAVGEFAGVQEAVDEMSHVGKVFLPDKEEHAIYSKIYSEVYCKVSGRLTPLYRKIKKIIGKNENEKPLEF